MFSFEAVAFVEAFVLAVLLAYVVAKGRRDENVELRGTKSITKEALCQAIQAENQFFWYWPILLVCWFLLYVVFAMGTILQHVPINDVARNLLNNLTSIPFVGMYYELAKKTAYGNEAQKTADGNELAVTPTVILALAVLLLAVGEYLLRCYTTYGKVGDLSSLISGLLVGVCAGLFVS